MLTVCSQNAKGHMATQQDITQLNKYLISFSRQTPQVQQVGNTVRNTFLTVKDVQRLI